jgi:hypothetical protein
VLSQNADVLTGIGVAGLSALVFAVLMRKPGVTQATNETRL